MRCVLLGGAARVLPSSALSPEELKERVEFHAARVEREEPEEEKLGPRAPLRETVCQACGKVFRAQERNRRACSRKCRLRLGYNGRGAGRAHAVAG